MKWKYVKTINVKRFVDALERIQERPEGIPGMMLLSGKYGLGRTKVAQWWTAQHENSIFIRALNYMSGRWLLSNIVSELGVKPKYGFQDLFDQCKEILILNPKVIFIDEMEYLTKKGQVIETLRDIHDVTGTTIVLIGMEDASKTLQRYPHLHDRLSEIVNFKPLIKADVRIIADEMCDVKVSDDAIDFLFERDPRYRPVVINLYRAEKFAKANSLKEVNAGLLRGRIK